MVAATTSILELNAREAELLAALIIKKYDFIELAESYKLQPSQLLAFTLSPAVNAHLQALKTFGDTVLALRLQENQLKSLDVLEKIATTSENPIEQRRAASTIFRGIGLQRERRSEPSGASRRRDTHGNGEWPSDGSGGRRAVPSDAPPLPRATPSSSLSTDDVINLATSALADHQNPTSAATLLAFLAGTATVNNHPVTPANLQNTLAAHIPATEVVQVQIGRDKSHHPGPPETFTTHIYLIHDGGRQIRIKTTLTREPATNSWLLSALHIGPNTS